MNRETVIAQLENYHTDFSDEAEFQRIALQFVHENSNFYQRTNLQGHVTTSAWILSPDLKSALLVHHKKLNRWLQVGGHLELEDETLEQGARREAIEESGLTDLELLSEDIFDVDLQPYPERGNEPAHFHYDVRYIYWAKNWELNADFAEVNHVKWQAIDDLMQQDVERGIRRMLLKTKAFQQGV